MCDTEKRFAKFTVLWIRQKCSAARFRVQQDGLDHRQHVSANALPVIRKRSRDAADVAIGRIRSDETLNKQTTDEGSRVGMLNEVVDGIVDVLQTGLTSGDHRFAST